MKKLIIWPKYFFLGFIFSFALCSLAGFFISKKARFAHFGRFYSHISASLDYYPTASELLATAEHNIDPNKIIVIIGGNSIARGEGQNIDELWSKKLQDILGNQYQVINFGYNGADFGSFGSVAYRMLREKYSKVIYVSSCSYKVLDGIDGGNYYKYIFWDAYYKKLFHPDLIEQKKITEVQKRDLRSDQIELHLVNILDSVFYFKSLWNWVSYRYFFTVWNGFAQPGAFKARRNSIDTSIDNKARAEEIKRTRFKDDLNILEKEHYSNWLADSNTLSDAKKKIIYQSYEMIFSPPLRQNIICFVPVYNPEYVTKLSKNDQKGYTTLLKTTQQIIQSLNYHAVLPNHLNSDDYIDLMHYVKSGGDKIAQNVATEIESIAEKNHFIKIVK